MSAQLTSIPPQHVDLPPSSRSPVVSGDGGLLAALTVLAAGLLVLLAFVLMIMVLPPIPQPGDPPTPSPTPQVAPVPQLTHSRPVMR